MKPGDLAYVKSTSTGDSGWVDKLYQTGEPFLILKGEEDGASLFDLITIWHDGRKKWISGNSIKVIKK